MIIVIGDMLASWLLYTSFAFVFATLLLSVRNLYKTAWNIEKELILFLVAQIGVLIANYIAQGASVDILFFFFISTVLLFATSFFARNFTLSGRYFFISYILLLVSGLLWSTFFIATIPVSHISRVLLFLAAPLVLVSFSSGIIQILERFEVLSRRNWVRPRFSHVKTQREYYPKVSLHVPVYAEPPEIVKETLTVLSKIDYPNFEVLVIDNNTKDEALWKPIQAYCEMLGSRFRFFHVENLTGAKAGALNFALSQTAQDAEIVGIVDSDYHVRPDFLHAFIPYFDDPKMGFVQSPHDYRNWENNPYLRMCYYEYQIFFHTTMVSINERDAAITVGTMCLIRKKALEEVGGWAVWCVTEDSELSIRIHAAGYSSVYLAESFGKGLIPQTFAGYKKQRYRWTAGPVQEFKHHFGLFTMLPWTKSYRLTLAQRLHHLNHGLDRATIGLGLLFTPIGLALSISMLVHREIIQVPFQLWLAATVLLVSEIFLTFLSYKVTLTSSLSDIFSATIANRALSHIVSLASLKTIFTSRASWERTDKFKTTSKFFRAIHTTKTELLLGSALIIFVIFAFLKMPVPGLFLMLLIGLSYKAFDYLLATVVALFAERNISIS